MRAAEAKAPALPHAPELGWSRRLLGRFHVTGLFWYRLHLWGVSHLPSWAVAPFVLLFTAFFFLVLLRIRRAPAANLVPVLGPCGWLERQRRIWLTLWNQAWCNTERYERLTTGRTFEIAAEGLEHWRAATGAAFDPTAPRAGWGTGHRPLGAALRRVLERSGLGPGAIDLVVSGASGSRAGDRLEALTLRAAWGDAPLPPIVAPKGVTGELGGGHLAAGILALEGAGFGPTPGFRRPDPELGIVPWAGGAFPGPVRRVLLSTLAVGGGAVWIVLEGAS